MSPSDWIAVVSIIATILIAVMGYVLKGKNDEIKLLKTKNELLEKTNSKLELQNLKLEITGQAAAQFFQQLPKAVGELNKEPE